MILAGMRRAASLYQDRIAIQMKTGDGYQRYTYRDLIKNIASAARALSELGIGRGDRVALLSENRPEWMFAYLSVVSLGAVIVPLDAQFTEKEVSNLLANSGAKAACVSKTTRRKLPSSGSIKIISFDPGEELSFSSMLIARLDATLPPDQQAGDLAAILYTSGTTGDPKGVMLSHGNLASNIESVIKLNLLDPMDNMLCLLPLHHTYPALACMLLPLSLGVTVTILNSLKGPDILACMKETGVSVLLGVPQLFAGLRRAIFDEIRKKPAPVRIIVRLLLGLNGLLRKTLGVNIGKTLFREVHARFGPRFRLSASGGARLEPDVYSDMSNLGFVLIEGYGLTETSPVCTFNPIGRQKAGSIGIPISGVEVRIANPDEQGQGEIAVRGPNVMLGYYRKSEETAEVVRDGWFHTGDLGYRDKEGYFFITGRSKEMIVLSTGKKIFPEELEKFYKQIPAIKEICLVQGERGLEAAIVPDFEYLRKVNLPNSREIIADEIEDISKDLPPYKRITGLKIFKDSLPVTRLGKLRRSIVRDMYLKDGERAERAVQEADGELLAGEIGKKLLASLEPFSAKKNIVPGDNLELDLGLDSLARVELVVSIEKTFGISLPDSFGSEVFTVKDAVLKIGDLLAQGAVKSAGQARPTWAQILRQEPPEVSRNTIRLEAGRLCSFGAVVVKSFLAAFYRLYGRMSVRGIENLPEHGPYIIAPNHLSYMDAPLIAAAIPWSIALQTFSLGHSKYFGGPVTSRIAKMIQVIPVDMDARLYGALQLSAYVLRRGKVLLVFPEGGRSRDGNFKEYKKGVGIIAKELNVPVIPAAIRGTFEMLPPDRAFPRPAKVSVSFGKAIHPEKMDYDEIVQTLYEETVKMMGEGSKHEE